MKKGKIVLKITALVFAAGLIWFILYMTNAFVGNPITANQADKAIREYVAKTYPEMNLEIGKVHYNFKFSSYSAEAKSGTSIDTHFSVYYKKGKVRNDDYESYVLGKFNTLTRLEEEYSKHVIPILSGLKGLESNRAMVAFDKQEYERAKDIVKVDMKFDKSMPFDMKVTIRTDLTDTSLKNIAGILEASHKTLIANGCKFSTYDIFSEYKDVLVMVSDVTPSDIESGELEQRLAAALERDEAERIAMENRINNKDNSGKDNPDKDTTGKDTAQADTNMRVSIHKLEKSQ